MKRFILGLLLIFTPLTALSDVSSDRVVLASGKVIEDVTASIRDGMVRLTYNNGRMQAYELEDVDLEASGLLPKAETAEEGDPTPVSSAPSLTGAARASAESRSEASMKITDADVEHVQPEPEPTEEEGEGQTGPLSVTNVVHDLVNDRVQVKGILTNNTEEIVEGIRVAAVGKGIGGAAVARGETILTQKIEPHTGVPFIITMNGSTEIDTVVARASKVSAQRERNRLQPARPYPPVRPPVPPKRGGGQR